MPVLNRAADMKEEMAEWRHALHENPQTKYEEEFASALVAQKLTEWGIPFKKGLGKTGIVATITGRKTESGKTIGLRADMDALDIEEKSGQPWASKNPGKMHACGHDGHTATLLGTAKYLAETRNFDGTVHLIFQPAEEGGRGAHAMIADGLFRDFDCDYVFALHNWPGVPLGKAGLRVGPLLASVDEFDITITGAGGHAAMPHMTTDPLVIAAHLVTALQSIVSRNVDPVGTAVVSVTNIHAGTGAFNIIADTATLSGTVRTFDNALRQTIKDRIETLGRQICAAFGATFAMEYEFNIDATVNSKDGVEMAARAASDILGEKNVDTDFPPSMGGEDFGAYLAERPGAFIVIGQGVPDKDSPHNKGLHNAGYDFNDDMLPVGLSYFTRLVEQAMPLEK